MMISGKTKDKFNEDQKAANPTLQKQSAFKALITNFLESDGDLFKMNKKFTKPLKIGVYQSEPFFSIHDGHHYI